MHIHSRLVRIMKRHDNSILSSNMAGSQEGDFQCASKSSKLHVTSAHQNKLIGIPISQYGEWYSAIMKNRFEYVSEMLQNASDTERERMVNGSFLYETTDEDGKLSIKERAKHCQFQLPIFIAAVFGAKETFDLLLQHGADVFAIDIGNSNILHALVYSEALISTTGQAAIFETTVESLSNDPTELKRLFFSENLEGMRPLELACQLGLFCMTKKILSVDGVYRFPRPTPSLCREVWYDVTDYETFGGKSRHSLSPLLFLANVTRDHLKNDWFRDFLSQPLIKKWMYSKIMNNMPEIAIWLCLRLVYHQIFVMIDPAKLLNCISSGKDLWLCASQYTAIFSGLVLLFDAISLVAWIISVIRGKNKVLAIFSFEGKIVNLMSQRLGMLSLAIMWTLYALLQFTNLKIREVYVLMYVTIILLNLFNALHCLKIFPLVGHFIITFYELLLDMMNFLLLFIAVHFTLSIAMYYTLKLFDIKDNPGYLTITTSVYTNFKVMLNMVNFDAYTNMHWGIVPMLHFVIVMLTAVILINFVVALMSNTVTEIFQHRYKIQQLYRLSIALQWEGRVKETCHRMLKIKRLRYPSVGLCFENDRIYVKCYEVEGSGKENIIQA